MLRFLKEMLVPVPLEMMMRKNTPAVGDVVRLKGGGPNLNVMGIVGEGEAKGWLVCCWIHEGAAHSAKFNPACVVRVQAEKKEPICG